MYTRVQQLVIQAEYEGVLEALKKRLSSIERC